MIKLDKNFDSMESLSLDGSKKLKKMHSNGNIDGTTECTAVFSCNSNK